MSVTQLCRFLHKRSNLKIIKQLLKAVLVLITVLCGSQLGAENKTDVAGIRG